MTQNPITIRLARPADAEAMATLVRAGVEASLVEPQGEDARRFRATLSPDEVALGLSRPERWHAVAEVQGEVRGLIQVRELRFVGQFFVDRAWQGRGIGSALWRFALQNARQAGASGEFEVRSSVAAEAVYRHFGFRPTGPVEVQRGFRFLPMRRDADAASSSLGSDAHPPDPLAPSRSNRRRP